jgi:hypothetical protein
MSALAGAFEAIPVFREVDTVYSVEIELAGTSGKDVGG